MLIKEFYKIHNEQCDDYDVFDIPTDNDILRDIGKCIGLP